MKKHLLIAGLVVIVLGAATTVLAQGPDGPGGPLFEAIEDLQSRVAALEAAFTIAQLTCAEGQVPKYSGGAWVCADDDDTTYEAGNQLDLAANRFDIIEGPGSDLDADTFDGMESERFLYKDGIGWIQTDVLVGIDHTLQVSPGGDFYVARVQYMPSRMHYLSIPQVAFQPTEDRRYQLAFVGTGALSELSAQLVAPVYLFDGARIDEFTCYFYDVYADGDLKCDLSYIDFSQDGNWYSLGQTDSNTSAGYVERSVPATGSGRYVDNQKWAYFVTVTPDPLVPGWPTTGPDMGIVGVVIEYTLYEAP